MTQVLEPSLNPHPWGAAPMFETQHPHSSSQLSATIVPSDLHLFLASVHTAYIWCTYILASKKNIINTHTHKIVIMGEATSSKVGKICILKLNYFVC